MLTGLVSLPPAEAVVWAAVPLYGTSADFHDDPDPFNDGRLGRPWPWLRSWSAFQLPSARAFAVRRTSNMDSREKRRVLGPGFAHQVTGRVGLCMVESFSQPKVGAGNLDSLAASRLQSRAGAGASTRRPMEPGDTVKEADRNLMGMRRKALRLSRSECPRICSDMDARHGFLDETQRSRHGFLSRCGPPCWYRRTRRLRS